MSKKGSAAKPKDEVTYEVGDIVLGKIRGYPAWPGQVRRVLPRELWHFTKANVTLVTLASVFLDC